MPRIMRFAPAAVTVLALAQLAPAQPILAQEWPSKPVRILVPFGAGGSADTIARFTAQRLGEAFRQQFVVENRPGAAGILAAEAVMRAPPDGYTLLMGNRSQMTIAPAVSKTSFDPVKDFTPVSVVATNPFVLVVHPSIPATNLADFVAYVRTRPNQLSYAASGAGSLSHLGMVLFLQRAGLQMSAVTYKGGAGPITDVLGGHVPVYLANLSAAVPHAAGGALRLLAVSGEKRAAQLPDIPTFIESGYPGYAAYTWQGLLAPAGTPKNIVDRIAAEITRAVHDSAFVEHLAHDGYEPLGNTPQDFAAMIASDVPLWADVVKAAGALEK